MSSGAIPLEPVSDLAGASTAVDLLVGAFQDDPTWSWIFADQAQRPELLRVLWTALVDSALRYSTLWLAPGATAAAVWIPPNGDEMTEDTEAIVTKEIADLLGADAPRALDAMEAFDVAHPRHEAHFSLSLLGTRVDQRGHGHGLGLLAATLAVVDAGHLPAYLEASNPANVALYERYGFERFGAFTLDGGPTVTTMWRSAT